MFIKEAVRHMVHDRSFWGSYNDRHVSTTGFTVRLRLRLRLFSDISIKPVLLARILWTALLRQEPVCGSTTWVSPLWRLKGPRVGSL